MLENLLSLLGLVSGIVGSVFLFYLLYKISIFPRLFRFIGLTNNLSPKESIKKFENLKKLKKREFINDESWKEESKKTFIKIFVFLFFCILFFIYAYAAIDRVFYKEDKNVKQETCLNSKDYVGECKDGKRHGQGTLIYGETGRKYVGEFKNGEQHGQGTATFPNGETYVGEFKDGFFHGKGTITLKDGTETIGIFKNGELREKISTSIK